MKKRLNIFALLILMALSIHTGYTLFYSWGKFLQLIKKGMRRRGNYQGNPICRICPGMIFVLGRSLGVQR